MDHLGPLGLLRSKNRCLFGENLKFPGEDLQLPLLRLLLFVLLLALELGQLPFGCPALLSSLAPLLATAIFFRALVHKDPLLDPEDARADKGCL